VDDMLDVARITRGKLELQVRPIELVDAVTKGIELASPILEQRGQFLDVEVPESGLCVNGDLDRLAQVVSNLLSNAAKFTPPAGRIRIQGRGVEGAGLELIVRDSGQGIAQELLPRLFDPFVQGGHLSLDRAQGGLGLGLAIVRGIVRAHGGDVRAKSEGAGRGSEFAVRLPRHVPRAEAVARASQTHGAPAPSVRRRILVVDDNEDVAELLARALARKGYDTATAFDGPSALTLARQFVPEAAILDLGLPVMDGFEVATKLKEMAGGRPLRIIALTGYGRPRDREQTRNAGFDAHLIKPVDVPALERLLTTLFASTE
jgi:CheY-like chemotaxis protein